MYAGRIEVLESTSVVVPGNDEIRPVERRRHRPNATFPLGHLRWLLRDQLARVARHPLREHLPGGGRRGVAVEPGEQVFAGPGGDLRDASDLACGHEGR